AVAKSYNWFEKSTNPNWEPLELNHDFYESPHGIRFTISPEARREILDRLLELNHERYDKEVRQGLHGEKKKEARQKAKRKERDAKSKEKKRSSKKQKTNNSQLSLIPEIPQPTLHPKESKSASENPEVD
ncbi:MAG TPA: hypothetical protein DCE42_21845, partial [Myxococcales bacterium]|nr:hypothetical protein [Myxococcales bacterium]